MLFTSPRLVQAGVFEVFLKLCYPFSPGNVRHQASSGGAQYELLMRIPLVDSFPAAVTTQALTFGSSEAASGLL